MEQVERYSVADGHIKGSQSNSLGLLQVNLPRRRTPNCVPHCLYRNGGVQKGAARWPIAKGVLEKSAFLVVPAALAADQCLEYILQIVLHL